MTRTVVIGSVLAVFLVVVWQLRQDEPATGPAGADRAAALQEHEEADPGGHAELEGVVSDPFDRAPAEDPPVVVERPSTAPRSDARVWLVGRVVEPAGGPVAERTLVSRFQVHRGMFGPTEFTAEVTTDADGRFRQDVDDAWVEKGTPLTLALGDEKRAVLAIPSHLGDGQHDLGQAELRGAVVLASGRVANERGDAVERADVWLSWGQDVTVPPGANPERYLKTSWWMLEDVRARTDEAGAFELVGFAPDVTLRIAAKKDGYLDAQPVECALGATGREIVLPAGDEIAGRVLLDEGVPLNRLQIEVQVGKGMPGFRRLQLDHDGGFLAEGLPPGESGAVSLVLKPGRDKLLEIVDVHTGPAATYRDPRLDPLDLRGKLTMATVTVLDAAGKRLDSAEGRVVGMHFPDTSSREHAPRETPGVLHFLGLGDGLDVEVWATGHRAQVLANVRGEITVRLDAGTAVRAELQSTPVLEEGESLRIMLEVEDEYWRQVAVAPIAPGGGAELVASHEGTHQFSLWLEVKTAQSAGSIRIQSPEAAPGFEVVQGVAPQVQTIVLTEEALTSARKDWRRFR